MLNRYNGENLSDIIESILELSSSNTNHNLDDYVEQKHFNFIDFFRFIYLSNFYRAMNYLEEFNIISDRREATQFIQELLKFCFLVLKTKISEESKEENLIKLANVIDQDNFMKVITFLTSTQGYLENYTNVNLIFVRLMLLIKNSFKKI
ncbi:MAG: hypothetical protein ACPL25_04580 [Ignavibacteria bacterium]